MPGTRIPNDSAISWASTGAGAKALDVPCSQLPQFLHDTGGQLAKEVPFHLHANGCLPCGFFVQTSQSWLRGADIPIELFVEQPDAFRGEFRQEMCFGFIDALRLQYPDAWLVQPLSGGTQQERLDSVRKLWQDGST